MVGRAWHEVLAGSRIYLTYIKCKGCVKITGGEEGAGKGEAYVVFHFAEEKGVSR